VEEWTPEQVRSDEGWDAGATPQVVIPAQAGIQTRYRRRWSRSVSQSGFPPPRE
jgi:hypothetical protein